jgi:hypothetical protein
VASPVGPELHCLEPAFRCDKAGRGGATFGENGVGVAQTSACLVCGFASRDAELPRTSQKTGGPRYAVLSQEALMKQSIPRVAATASALLLFFSLLPNWPRGYHLLLRFVVGITAVLLVARAEERKAPNWIFVWIAVAILYNPIVPLRLPPILFQVVTLVCGALFLYSIRRFRL